MPASKRTIMILTGTPIFLLSFVGEGSYSMVAAFIETVQTYDFGNIIAVLVAVGGYLLEHWLARKASQVEKQMERVEAQSHQLLIPITVQFHAMWLGSLLSFVDKHVGVVLAHRDMLDISCEGLRNLSSNPLLDAVTSLNRPESALLVWEVMFTQVGKEVKQPRVTSRHELPLALHNEIKMCNRDSKLWNSYEAFIRHSFVPAVEAIAAIINENGHLMEPVPAPRLAEIFGTEGNGYGLNWTLTPRMWFYSLFLAYSKSWREVLVSWDGGNREEMRPSVDFPVGILMLNVEAQSIVADAEQRLLGMSQMHGKLGIKSLWSQFYAYQRGKQENQSERRST